MEKSFSEGLKCACEESKSARNKKFDLNNEKNLLKKKVQEKTKRNTNDQLWNGFRRWFGIDTSEQRRHRLQIIYIANGCSTIEREKNSNYIEKGKEK